MSFFKRELKLCKNCKYCETSVSFSPRCHHPSAFGVDLVNGNNEPGFCSAMRILRCGERAKYFEQRACEHRNTTHVFEADKYRGVRCVDCNSQIDLGVKFDEI